ncbi:MAG: GMC family oxidoreductase [Caldilineales bacterium]|nr:GMC family oxidoreductase [Caldilineales bacterium]
MFIDARAIPAGSEHETDICIIGAGAAGITLALELRDAPFRICLLESGGLGDELGARRLNQADSIGLPYYPLDENRWRGLGGTTARWAGWCRSLDEIDFEYRDWTPESGWPISRSNLLPHYRRAHDYCQLLPFDYETNAWADRLRAKLFDLSDDGIKTRVYHMAPPTRFGPTYRERLATQDNLQVWLHATAMELKASAGGDSIERLEIGCLGGNRFSVKARVFILASGAIEAARLLLLSRDRWAEGIGNHADQVGRYFMEHLHFDAGRITLASLWRPSANFYTATARPIVGRLFPSDGMQKDLQILNCNIGLSQATTERLPYSVRAERRIRAKEMTNRWAKRWITEAGAMVANLGSRVETSAGLSVWPAAYDLHYTLEQAPNPHSRVTLSDHCDELGMPRTQLNWQLSDLEQRSFERLQTLFASALTARGIGEWHPDPQPQTWPPPPLQGLRGHHMGTTRMHPNPRLGVVDADCRVHGVNNLYVASSSVFPTSGSGTPTLTIVALSIRLADHLKRQ